MHAFAQDGICLAVLRVLKLRLGKMGLHRSLSDTAMHAPVIQHTTWIKRRLDALVELKQG